MEAEPRKRTSELLAALAHEHATEEVTFGELLDLIEQRAFGFLLIFLALPTFIPSPIGLGGVVGFIAAFLGLQMIVGLQHPWLPKWVQRRGLPRSGMVTFLSKLGRLMAKIERVCKPRWLPLTEGIGERASGVFIIFLGCALALPIPFTNYPFGAVLLAMGIALTERDGIILALCWGAIIAISVLTVGLSDAIIHATINFFS